MTKAEGRTEVLHAFFALVCSSKTSCFLGAEFPELGERAGEQNEAPQNPRVNVQWPAAPHRHTQVYGARWDPPKGAEGPVEVLTKTLSKIHQLFWLTKEIPAD